MASHAGEVADRCTQAEQNGGILDMSSCRLKFIPAGIYTLLKDCNTIVVNASHNVILKVTTKFFENFTKITELNLSHNRLRVIHEDLSLCGNLRQLDISHNRITALPSEMFLLPDIKIIKAGNNQITEVNIQEVTAASTLEELELHNNPLTTECHDELIKLQHPKVKLLPDHTDELEKLDTTMSTSLQIQPTQQESDGQLIDENGLSDQDPLPPAPRPPPINMPPPPPPPTGKKFLGKKRL